MATQNQTLRRRVAQRLHIARRNGEAEEDSYLSLAHKHQFALELDHLAECIRSNKQPRTPGEEGLQDQIIMAPFTSPHAAVTLSN